MKKRNTYLLLTLVPAVFLWAGCSPNQTAARSANGAEPPAASEPAEMDHSQMDHSQMDHSKVDMTVPAGAAATAADGVKPYPLTKCVVSGEKLGEMGKPQRLVYQGQEMKFCCKDCVKDFQASPDKFMAKLAEAAAAASTSTKPMDMSGDAHDHSEHQH